MNPKTILVPVLAVGGVGLATYMIYRVTRSSPEEGEKSTATGGALGGGSNPSSGTGTDTPPSIPGTGTGGSNPSTTTEGGVVSDASGTDTEEAAAGKIEEEVKGEKKSWPKSWLPW